MPAAASEKYMPCAGTGARTLVMTDRAEQWPHTLAHISEYADYLVGSDAGNLNAIQVADWMSKGLAAVQHEGYAEFKGTDMLCPDQFGPIAPTLYSESLVSLSLLCLLRRYHWKFVLSFLYSRASTHAGERPFWVDAYSHMSWLVSPSRRFQTALAVQRPDLVRFILACRQRLALCIQNNARTDAFIDVLIGKDPETRRRSPWNVVSGSAFEATLKMAIGVAEVQVAAARDGGHCDLLIDNQHRVSVSERDRILLALVLLFHAGYSGHVPWINGVPPAAPAAFRRAVAAYPEVWGRPGKTCRRFVRDFSVSVPE